MSSTSPTAIDPDDPRSLIQSPVLVLDKLSPWKTSQSSSPLNQAPTSHLRAIQDLHLEMDFDSAATSPTTAVVSPEDGFLQDQLPWVQSTEQAQTAPLSPTTAPFVKMEMNLNDTLGASQAAGLFKTIQPEVFHSNPMESSESSHHPTPKFALVPLSVGVVESLNDSLRAARLAQFHDPSPTPPSINEDPMTLSRSSSAEISEQTSRLAIRGSNVRRQRRKEENTARVTSVLDKLTARRHSRSFSHVNPAYIGQDVDETASQLGAAPRNTLASSSSSPDLSVALSGDGTTSGTEEDDGTKVYPCTHCKKVFARISNLRAHESLHAGDRPHACPYCEAKFARKFDMTRHARIHSGEMPYECPHCHKRFTRSDGLNRHVMKQCGDSAEHRNVHTRHVSDGGRPWGRRDSLTQALQQTAAQNTVANVGVPLQTSVGPGTTGSVLPTAPLFLMPSYQQYVFAATQPSSMEPPLEWQAATHQQQIPLEISNMASTDAFQQQQPRFVYLTTFGQNPSVQTHIPTGNLSLLPEPMAEEFNHHLYSQNTYTTSQLSHE